MEDINCSECGRRQDLGYHDHSITCSKNIICINLQIISLDKLQKCRERHMKEKQ